MAVEQTMAFTNSVFSVRSGGRHIPSLPQNPNSLSFRLCSSPLTKESKQVSIRRVRCSYDYNNNGNSNSSSSSNSNLGVYEYDRVHGGPQPQYARPSEIQWKKELCNLVHLIGIVGVAVQIKHLNSGKVVAWSRLAVRKSQNDTIWINLTFWDELAHVAFQHVEKGNKIYVSGRLISDTVEGDDGNQQTYYKVVVQQLNFVERNSTSVTSYDWNSNSMAPGKHTSYDGNFNSMAPGKHTSYDLNSNSMAPGKHTSYDGNSNSMAPGRKQNNYTKSNTGSTEELWQAYFANPTEWWDNRKNKRSPNYPDFKHKDTGEALWVEGRYNPAWVKSQLSILDSKMEAFHEHNGSNHTNFDNFSMF